MCCSKPTIAIIAMQECHDNDKIEPHNHNEYPLLYKEARDTSIKFGQILECQKCYILVATQELMHCLIYPHLPSGSCVHIRQCTRACFTTITCGWGIFHGTEHFHTHVPEVTNFFTDYIRLYLGLY